MHVFNTEWISFLQLTGRYKKTNFLIHCAFSPPMYSNPYVLFAQCHKFAASCLAFFKICHNSFEKCCFYKGNLPKKKKEKLLLFVILFLLTLAYVIPSKKIELTANSL